MRGPWFVDVTEVEVGATSWKSMVKAAIRKKVERDLKNELLEHSKAKHLAEEDFGRKGYLTNTNLNEARTQFAMKTKMLKVKTHYWGNPKFSQDLW